MKLCLFINFLYNPSGFESSSLCFPHSIIFPWSRTATILAFLMVDRRWAIINTVLPSISRSRASCTRYSFSASNALNGKTREKAKMSEPRTRVSKPFPVSHTANFHCDRKCSCSGLLPALCIIKIRLEKERGLQISIGLQSRRKKSAQ